jgi:hypothetical protein
MLKGILDIVLSAEGYSLTIPVKEERRHRIDHSG